MVSAQAERKTWSVLPSQVAALLTAWLCVLRMLLLLWFFPLSAQEAVLYILHVDLLFLCVEFAHSALLLLSHTAGWNVACYPGVLALCIVTKLVVKKPLFLTDH